MFKDQYFFLCVSVCMQWVKHLYDHLKVKFLKLPISHGLTALNYLFYSVQFWGSNKRTLPAAKYLI